MKIHTVVLCLLTALAGAGCKSTTFEHRFADGSSVRVSDTRCLMRSAASLEIEPSTNGLPRLSLEAKSSADSDAFSAVGEAVIHALKGAK